MLKNTTRRRKEKIRKGRKEMILQNFYDLCIKNSTYKKLSKRDINTKALRSLRDKINFAPSAVLSELCVVK